MPDVDPRWEQVDLVGRQLTVELCQFLYLLRTLVVAAFAFRPNTWDVSLLLMLGLVTMPALVGTFWLPRLVDSVRSHPLLAGVDVALVAVALYVSSAQGIVFLISLFAAATIGLLYRGVSAIMLACLLGAAYLVACTRQEPLPQVLEWLSALVTYAAVVTAAAVLQRRIDQLTRYGISATQTVAELRERARLAREMHDGVVKTLHGIALSARGLARGAAVPASVRGQLDAFSEAADFGVRQARETLVELRVDQDDRPFIVVVEEVVARWSDRTGIAHEVSGLNVVDLEPGPRTELLACLREALDNVAEHARAANVAVTVDRVGSEVVLAVSDDGRGLDAGRLRTAQRQGHFGVRGMTERMVAIGGWLTVEPSAAGGVTVRCGVPLPLG